MRSIINLKLFSSIIDIFIIKKRVKKNKKIFFVIRKLKSKHHKTETLL